jgi:hypothetical protein
MSDYAFRQLVREEVVAWCGQQKDIFAALATRVGESVAKDCFEQIRRALLVRLGTLQPDEREIVTRFVQEVRVFIAEVIRYTDYQEGPAVALQKQTAEIAKMLQQMTSMPGVDP